METLTSQGWFFVLVGAFVGLASAGLGALLDHRISRKASGEDTRGGTPPLILIVVGLLAVAGAISIGVSFALTRSLASALLMGLGVGAGFFVGFALIFLGAVLSSRGRSG